MTAIPVERQKCAVLRKTSLVDFPPYLSATVFFRGCNLRCPYCYNRELVLEGETVNEGANFSCAEEIIFHLEKRRNVLKALTVSGGEALLNPATEVIVKKAKSLGYKIKLDTNGTCPSLLEKFIKEPMLSPDYIAMDLKTSTKKLWKLAGHNEFDEKQKEELNLQIEEKLRKSITMLSALPPQKREWRTVLVPHLVNLEDISEMAQMLPKDASWYFTSFAPQQCLDESYQRITPYNPLEEEKIILEAKKIIRGVEYR